MSYTVWETSNKFGPRKGLEGPFTFVNGRVLYYDTKEGKYWDPLTDFYVEQAEMDMLHDMLAKALIKS